MRVCRKSVLGLLRLPVNSALELRASRQGQSKVSLICGKTWQELRSALFPSGVNTSTSSHLNSLRHIISSNTPLALIHGFPVSRLPEGRQGASHHRGVFGRSQVQIPAEEVQHLKEEAGGGGEETTNTKGKAIIALRLEAIAPPFTIL